MANAAALKVLVVDDEQEICDLLHGYLIDEGYRVSIATDGAGLRDESRIDSRKK